MKKHTYGGRVTNTKNSDCENCNQEMNMIYKKGNKYLCRKCNSMNFDCCDCNYTCPNCSTKRVNPFPVSDETEDVYCPDCNATLNFACCDCKAECLHCEKKFDCETDIQLCQSCMEKYDVKKLWQLHDSNQINALDFNDNAEIRNKFINQ